MKKIIILGLAVVGMLLWQACSNYTYYSIGGKNANLSKYHFFAWLPPVDTTTNAGYNDLADQSIRDEATAQLQKKGLVLNSRRPDLLVRYAIMFKDRVRYYDDPQYTYVGGGFYPRVSRWGNIYYRYAGPYPVYVGSEIERVPYKQGTVMIDLIDRNTRHVVWRGYAVGEMDSQKQSLRDLPEVVDGIINKLPLSAMQ
ncbi:hypothetical protein BEL04_14955 [Mucilaginibacter sp. PPCGB 2223]|uniref:DUF4136 domain-containing protein n=1 Tax=Mucilaginibacter sp. PPCGB 2223 TaxID=1886027 RepID=UPI000824E618|nr:DUF4136 domain-containing protein [Mucilaginibacter sp. PPCGB 2223]OCX51329.1 hypothetical protein BEL04_14955 [Mucilaginibacter sp. PPCGB 2223]